MLKRALALPRSHCRVQTRQQERQNDDDDRGQPGHFREPQRQPRPPRQHAHVIDLGADAERLELGPMQNRNRAGDVAGLLHLEECVHEGLEGAGVPEVDGDNAAAAARIEGRLDALDDRVGRAGGGQVAGFGVLVGLELPPGVMQQRTKNPCVSRT